MPERTQRIVWIVSRLRQLIAGSAWRAHASPQALPVATRTVAETAGHDSHTRHPQKGIDMLVDQEDQTPLSYGLREVARSEIKSIKRALRARAPHRGVHEARKAIRRLRSLLALGGETFAVEAERIDRALAGLSTSLGTLRDAQVAVQEATRLLADAREPKSRNLWRITRRQLIDARRAGLTEALAKDPGFCRRIAKADRVAESLESLSWCTLTPAAIRVALDRSARRVRKAERIAAGKRACASERHRLRRRVRRLRMQLQTLTEVHAINKRPADRRSMFASVPELPPLPTLIRLTDTLGAEQDVRLLAAAVQRLPHCDAVDAARAEIARLIDAKH